ncbi:MAG: hypothetical protein OEY66_12315 [Gammaproteobacteria bacterium]|nr:hypothetical protein [Gammaproteobacteria bacterium]
MNQPPVIVIINKKPYTLTATDSETIRAIPTEDRQQLIALLEALKLQESPVPASAMPISAGTNAPSYTAATDPGSVNVPDHQTINRERLHSGDADALMAQLIMEENLNKKPGLTKQSIHKWTAVIAVIVFFLVLIL